MRDHHDFSSLHAYLKVWTIIGYAVGSLSIIVPIVLIGITVGSGGGFGPVEILLLPVAAIAFFLPAVMILTVPHLIRVFIAIEANTRGSADHVEGQRIACFGSAQTESVVSDGLNRSRTDGRSYSLSLKRFGIALVYIAVVVESLFAHSAILFAFLVMLRQVRGQCGIPFDGGLVSCWQKRKCHE